MSVLLDSHGAELAIGTSYAEHDAACMRRWSKSMLEQAKRQSYFSRFIRPDIVDEFGHSIYDKYPRIGGEKT